VSDPTVVFPSIRMPQEVYDSMSRLDRNEAWMTMIAKLGITGAYLPFPFRSDETDEVGMTIVPVGALKEAAK